MTDTNSTSDETSVDTLDDIAELLIDEPVGEDVEEQVQDTEDDDVEAEEPSDDSTEEVDESENEEESDTTWSGVLGVQDSQVVLDDNGDFTGINIDVNGETGTVTVPDLIAGYQTNKNNTHKSQELSSDRKNFEQVRETAVSEYTNRLQDVAKLTEFLNNTLLKEYEGTDWNQLRVSDPAEYAARMQDFNTRQGEIKSVYAAINQERNWQADQTAGQAKESDDARLKTNIDQMIVNNPEWADSEKLNVAFKEMSDFAVSTYGFTTDEFNQVADSRLVELIKDASKYRKGLNIADKKVMKKVPKFQKAGGGKRKAKVTKLDQLTKTAKNTSGSAQRGAQTNAIAELLTGNS